MNNYLHKHYRETKSKFEKFSQRLTRSQEKGEFQKLSQGKQNFLVNRVKKLWEKLRILEMQLKIGSAAASLALLLMVSNVNAQEQFIPAADKNPLPAATIFGVGPMLADLDGDGDLDMFLSNFDYYSTERILYYKNTGSPTIPDFTKVSANESPFRNSMLSTGDGAMLGDIDGDLDIDILAANGALFRNTGDKNNPLFSDESTGYYTDDMDLGDIDGDGDLDLIVVRPDSSVIIYPNEGDASNFNINQASPLAVGISNWDEGIDYVRFTKVVDLDNDGDLDMLFGGELYDYDSNFFDGNFVHIAENTGSPTVPAFTIVDGADNPYSDLDVSRIQLGDLDGDGDYDVLGYDYSSGISYHELNNGTMVENTSLIPELYDGITLPVNYILAPQFADMDGDGDMDLLVMDYYDNWSLAYFEYKDTGKQLKYIKDESKTFPFLKGDVPIELPFTVDMDLDGDLDVVVLSYSYYSVKYIYYRNTGTKESPVYEEDMTNPIPAPDNVIMMPSFSDIDGDGDVDIFYRDEVYEIDSVYSKMAVSYLENTGSASQPAFTKKTGTDNPLEFVNEQNYGDEFGYFRFQFGDIDEDGDLDVAFTDYYGSIYYLKNVGSKTEPSFVDRTGNSPFGDISGGYYGTINLVDLDKDGDLDLFTHGFYGTVTNYYENTGWKGTGVSDQILTEQLDLFPNPVENDINIRMENELRGDLSYEILTLQGKRVSNGVVDKPGDLLEFSVSGNDLSAGMYLFRLWSEDDVYISKFVKR